MAAQTRDEPRKRRHDAEAEAPTDTAKADNVSATTAEAPRAKKRAPAPFSFSSWRVGPQAQAAATVSPRSPPGDAVAQPAPTAATAAAPKDPQDAEEAEEAKVEHDAADMIGAEAAKVSQEDPADVWPADTVPYAALCALFDRVGATTKRLEKISLCATFFARVLRDRQPQLLSVVYLCINKLGPSYTAPELGVGESLIMKALAGATGGAIAAVKAEYVREGDLGNVAVARRARQRSLMGFAPRALTVSSVFKALDEIGHMSGPSSQTRKVVRIQGLLSACGAGSSEARYLVRSLENKLRIGLAEQTVLIALAHAKVLLGGQHTPEAAAAAAEQVKDAFSQCPNYDILVGTLAEHPLADLGQHCRLTPGIPLKPMLAHPTKALSEVLDRFEGHAFTCEYKYDGERAQIHRTADGKVCIYSRNSEDLSSKYPEVIARLQAAQATLPDTYVLDCEAVAWDLVGKQILPFQVLSTRKRKNVEVADVQVQVCLFAFDLLYLNGEPLVQKSLRDRRALLQSSFAPVPGELEFAVHDESTDVEHIQAFLEQAIGGHCEGLMVKTLDHDASYEPSRRSRNWLKVKKDYLSGIGDSLDLVVIGAYTGRGKRTGVYGGFLLACYDPASEAFQTICKLGTGFSEEDLARLAAELRPLVIPGPKPYYSWTDAPIVKPDVWFDAQKVWEVKAADLSLSPVHRAAAGLVEANRGISLRFPRFVHERPDKSPEDATHASQAVEMYRSQQLNKAQRDDAGGAGGADDDFEY